jgi:signal transduction histidine kinase
MVSSTLDSGDERPGGKIVVFHDVTHFRELDQMKTRFVSDVSH